MQVKEIMSTDIEWVEPDATIDEVAQKMREKDSGAILVGEEDNMVGMITDHDIVTKVIAEEQSPEEVKANDVMSSPVASCSADEDVEEVADHMVEQHVLRMLVVDQDNHVCGVVAHSDLADAVVRNGMYGSPLAQKVAQLASKIAA